MNAIVLDLSPETIEAMRARLERHLYGKAKTLSPNAVKAAELAEQGSTDCHWCGSRLCKEKLAHAIELTSLEPRYTLQCQSCGVHMWNERSTKVADVHAFVARHEGHRVIGAWRDEIHSRSER